MTSSLSDLAVNITEKVVGANKVADTPYVGLEHLITDVPRIAGSALASTSVSVNTVFQVGDTLFGKLRPNLKKVALADFDGYCSTDILVLRAVGGNSAAFLSHQLRSRPVLDYAAGTAFGTKMPRTSWSMLRKLPVFAPPVPEQRRIAEILDTLDDQIRTTEQIIAKLRIAKDGLLTDLFTRGIELNGQLRDPVASPDDFKPSGSGLIPKSWRVDSVTDLISSGDLADIQDGNHGELHPKRNEFVLEGIPFLMAKDISGGRIDFDHCYRIRREQYARLRVGFSKPGDVLLSHKGTIGEVAIVPEDAQEVMLTPQVTYYRPARSLASEFLFYYMQSVQFQRALRMIAGQSTRDYVGISMQRRLLYIPVPETSEQHRIVSIARVLDSRINNEMLQLGKLRLVRVGLTSDLLTGRVHVPLKGIS